MEKLYASVTLSAPSTATAADTRGTNTNTRAEPKGGGRRLSTKGQRREMTGPITELINPSATLAREAVEAGEPPLKYSTIVTRIKAQTKAAQAVRTRCCQVSA